MTKIIDAWMQHPTEAMLHEPMFESLRRWTGGKIPAGGLPLEFTLAALDAAKVDQALISAWHAPYRELISNDFVAEAVKQAAGRLHGIATVNLYRPMDAVRELRQRVKQDGFIGLRLLPWLWDLPPDDRRYYPLYAECCELGIPFCTQAGHTGPLMPSEPGRPIPYLDHVALEFPELKIVAGHIGHPWTTEMIAMATKYENVYIDTSAYTPKRYPPELVTYMKGHGMKKVLFGSNYPMLLPKQCLDQLGLLDLNDEQQQHFLHDNTARVFALNSRN